MVSLTSNKCRVQEAVRARAIVSVVAARVYKIKYIAIASRFQYRDHTTVCYHLKKHKDTYAQDPLYADAYDKLLKEISMYGDTGKDISEILELIESI
jgi:chromosomal replication initiation ATPase DnaA